LHVRSLNVSFVVASNPQLSGRWNDFCEKVPHMERLLWYLFYFQPNSNWFRTRSGAVHEERAEWTSSWHGLCSKMWNPPRMEVETLWVSTWKEDISFGNKSDCQWVEGVRSGFWTIYSPYPATKSVQKYFSQLLQ